jgi:hypothetical protein
MIVEIEERIIMFNKNLIWGIVTVTLVVLMIIVDLSKHIPQFYSYLLLTWSISIVYDIYKSKKYLKNIPQNELRIRNTNDSYYGLLPFIMGSILVVISILFFFIVEDDKTMVVALFISGIAYILQGLNSVPSAILIYQDGILNFENEKVKKTIIVQNILDFTIKENEIILNNGFENRVVFQYLELNQVEIEKTEKFLRKYIN